MAEVSDGKLAKMSKSTGLALFFSKRNPLTQRTIARLKYHHGVGRNVMMIGSTGRKMFVDPQEDLHDVLENCLEAKILLLNPCSEEAREKCRCLPSTYSGEAPSEIHRGPHSVRTRASVDRTTRYLCCYFPLFAFRDLRDA